MHRTKFGVIVTLVTLLSTAAIARSDDLLRQVVSAGGISADVTIGTDLQRGFYRVDVIFRQLTNATNVRVGCLSAYRDFTYDLRDASGRPVPVNKTGIENPPFGETTQIISSSALPKGYTMPSCSQSGVNASTRLALLSVIYPHLAPGRYTLHMIFSPRGSSQTVALQPVVLVVASHPVP